MTLAVGVIGTGAIGNDHIRRMTDVVPGARVVAVSDIDAAAPAAPPIASAPPARMRPASR